MAKKSADSSQPEMTKTEAALKAIADGVVVPTEASAYIKSKFGLDVSPARFASIKYEEKKKAGGVKVKVKAKAKAVTPKVKATVKPKAETAPSKTDDSQLLAALEALKPLVAELGLDKVKRLADLLG